MKQKTYLGDGVYLELSEFGDLVLTTENGIATTNRIVLDQYAYENLTSWVTNKLLAHSNTGTGEPPG